MCSSLKKLLCSERAYTRDVFLRVSERESERVEKEWGSASESKSGGGMTHVKEDFLSIFSSFKKDEVNEANDVIK